MRLAPSFITALVSLFSFQAVSADNNHSGELSARFRRNGRSVNVAANQRRDIIVAPRHQLQKRYSNARFTFYKTGLGACGDYNTDNEFPS